MLTLYPPISAYANHRLKVDALHNLYFEEAGNPYGIPVLFLHGGPGLGCNADHRRYFDPGSYRIILVDQRGAGQSTPHAELQDNTTQYLVADLEIIRQHLKIEKWLLFGGSWGSTLALVYAQQHAHCVLGLILRGISLCRKQDIQWFYENGVTRIFPDAWEEFVHHLPIEERRDVLGNYYRRLMGHDEIARMGAAKAWTQWEAVCCTLQPRMDVLQQFVEPHTAISLARIEAHYFIHGAFLAENQIINHCDKLANIPGIIVHGRYDMVCPLDNAYALHQLGVVRNCKLFEMVATLPANPRCYML